METHKSEQYKNALSKAADILTFGDNTEKKLREKLKRKGFDDDVIDKAVEKLETAGLLNDERLMFSNIAFLANTKLYGKARIRVELLKRGFPGELISRNFDKGTEDIDFKENCYKYVKRKGLSLKFIDKESTSKVSAMLVRHGFNYAEIKFAFLKVKEENEQN